MTFKLILMNEWLMLYIYIYITLHQQAVVDISNALYILNNNNEAFYHQQVIFVK